MPLPATSTLIYRPLADRALSSDNDEAQQIANEVIHRLSAQGEDYRNVLVVHKAKSGL